MTSSALAAGAMTAMGMGMGGGMIPSLTGGAGGAAGPASGTANNGISLPLSTPTNIDGSGWVVNFGNGNTSKAGGNSGANDTRQTSTPTASSLGSGAPNSQTGMLPIPGQFGYQAMAGGDYMPPMPPMGPNTAVLVLGAVGMFLMLAK